MQAASQCSCSHACRHDRRDCHQNMRSCIRNNLGSASCPFESTKCCTASADARHLFQGHILRCHRTASRYCIVTHNWPARARYYASTWTGSESSKAIVSLVRTHRNQTLSSTALCQLPAPTRAAHSWGTRQHCRQAGIGRSAARRTDIQRRCSATKSCVAAHWQRDLVWFHPGHQHAMASAAAVQVIWMQGLLELS